MVLGIGLDSVEIARFNTWKNYQRAQLLRIFSEQEIHYCLEVPAKSAERFAVRFAVREAFFKALSSAQAKKIPFLTLCKQVRVKQQKNGTPFLAFEPSFFGLPKDVKPLITCTHTAITATALVVLSSKSLESI